MNEREALYEAADLTGKIELVIEWLDRGRLDSQGGYPSDFLIHEGWVFIATIDYDGAPQLIARPIDKFLKEYELTWKDI